VEIKRDNRKVQNVKKKETDYLRNITLKENLVQVIEELKQKVSAKMQRLSSYR